jgi:transcriptional regulator NrdR family protein
MAFPCPTCGLKAKVTNVKQAIYSIVDAIYSIRRRQRCPNGHVFWTAEAVADAISSIAPSNPVIAENTDATNGIDSALMDLDMADLADPEVT